jgi:hypothetical protein
VEFLSILHKPFSSLFFSKGFNFCTGVVKTATKELNACINKVENYLDKGTLSPAEGQALVDAANAVIDVLKSTGAS